MSSHSRSQQSATIIAFPGSHRSAAVASQQSQHEVDMEERRWERRNIQD
jgi:hypothetical protein